MDDGADWGGGGVAGEELLEEQDRRGVPCPRKRFVVCQCVLARRVKQGGSIYRVANTTYAPTEIDSSQHASSRSTGRRGSSQARKRKGEG